MSQSSESMLTLKTYSGITGKDDLEKNRGNLIRHESISEVAFRYFDYIDDGDWYSLSGMWLNVSGETPYGIDYDEIHIMKSDLAKWNVERFNEEAMTLFKNLTKGIP